MKNVLILFMLFISSVSYAQNEFITTWRTTAANESITIPTTGGGYNYTVDWGDGSLLTTGITGNVSHTYAVAGDYVVKISGAFPRIFFFSLSQTERNQILEINQWGNIQWTSMYRAFMHCHNLVNNATDTPDLSNVTSMELMFNGAFSFNGGDLSSWDVSNVTNMRGTFADAFAFNSDLSSWDVSNVTDMSWMFYRLNSFNSNLSTWNVSNVTDMSYMFLNDFAFNSDLSTWDVSNVTNMSNMFYSCSTFNSDLSSWDVSNVTNMSNMFSHNSTFNSDLSTWDVSNVTNMSRMFFLCPFNQDLSTWDVSSVTGMDLIFYYSGLSTTDYDNTLISWASQNVKPNVILGADNLQYCNSTTARQSLITNYGWTFSGDSPAVIDNAYSNIVSSASTIMETQSTAVKHYGPSCDALIATIEQSGANPVSGNITTNVWKQATVPTFNGNPYVARHYEITPSINPSTATGKITLYFTQTEFDDYNVHPGSMDDLPTNPTDMVGIANIQFTKYAGTSSDGTGQPSSYSSAPTTIDPVDSDVIWNATMSRWEITFGLVGFSGFFLGTTSVALPVELLDFQARKHEKQVQLTWQTASETNNEGFQIEHSIDGRDFQTIGFIAGQGNTSIIHSYDFNHENPLEGINYYRLKQMDFDGGFEYSKIVSVDMPSNEKQIHLYPNPTSGILHIDTEFQEGQITITHINGKIVHQSGWDNTPINISDFPKGIYILSFRNHQQTYISKIQKL